jgi:hypothetical protein
LPPPYRRGTGARLRVIIPVPPETLRGTFF